MGSGSFGSVGLKTALLLRRSGFREWGLLGVDRGDRLDGRVFASGDCLVLIAVIAWSVGFWPGGIDWW